MCVVFLVLVLSLLKKNDFFFMNVIATLITVLLLTYM